MLIVLKFLFAIDTALDDAFVMMGEAKAPHKETLLTMQALCAELRHGLRCQPFL